MITEKRRKISATGILTCNIIAINESVIEWLDAKDFNLADLAKTLGIDNEHKVKATITIEIVEQPCELCGKLTTGDKICQNCGKMICDECAKIDAAGDRYCPICLDLQKSIQKLA
jgi:formylmethanofuran dehydrogenase subunit E